MKTRLEKPRQIENATRRDFIAEEIESSIAMQPPPEGAESHQTFRRGKIIEIEIKGKVKKEDIRRHIDEGIRKALGMQSTRWKL